MILKDQQGKQLEVEIDFNTDGSAFFCNGVYLENGTIASDEALKWMTEEHSPVLAHKQLERERERREASMGSRRDDDFYWKGKRY
jgi:hypothetical protein